MKILVTGAAGFIGSRLMCLLAQRGDEVMGIDSINDYYDVRLKYGRLAEAGIEMPQGGEGDKASPWPYGVECRSRLWDGCRFVRMAIDDKEALDALFKEERFDAVVNLAAQAGVRYSLDHPYAYLQSNLLGFLNVLEACRYNDVKHLVYASSSSVYGLNESVPFKETDKTDAPVSLYAATKKSNELMAHSYVKLYGLPCTGLRYFTVYGPWGRPDMAPTLFADAIAQGRPIDVFNGGDMLRDFTYIDDVVEGTIKVLDNPPSEGMDVPYRLFNIGCSSPVNLMDFIGELEQALGRKAQMNMMPMQPGDVYQTNADTSRLEAEVGYKPQVTLHEGIRNFVEWYKSDKNPLK